MGGALKKISLQVDTIWRVDQPELRSAARSETQERLRHLHVDWHHPCQPDGLSSLRVVRTMAEKTSLRWHDLAEEQSVEKKRICEQNLAPPDVCPQLVAPLRETLVIACNSWQPLGVIWVQPPC